MPLTEKEYNGNLWDQKHLLKRLRKIAVQYDYTEIIRAIDEEDSDIDDKLYQNPIKRD